jgi:hypothetical protein
VRIRENDTKTRGETMKKNVIIVLLIAAGAIAKLEGQARPGAVGKPVASNAYSIFEGALYKADPADIVTKTLLAATWELLPEKNESQKRRKKELAQGFYNKFLDDINRAARNTPTALNFAGLLEQARTGATEAIKKVQIELDRSAAQLDEAQAFLRRVQDEKNGLQKAVNEFAGQYLDLTEALNRAITVLDPTAPPISLEEEDQILKNLAQVYDKYLAAVGDLEKTGAGLGMTIVLNNGALDDIVRGKIETYPSRAGAHAGGLPADHEGTPEGATPIGGHTPR